MSLQPVGPPTATGRVTSKVVRDPEGNPVTQDAYDDLVDEHDEVQALLAAAQGELAELRRRFGIVEKLPVAGHIEGEAGGGDIIKRPVLLRRLVLAALHGDIIEEPHD